MKSSAALLPFFKRSACNTGMHGIGVIRLGNLERLIEEAGGLERVAEAADTSSVYLSQLRNHAVDRKTGRPREMGTAMARRLESAFKKPPGWMDAPQMGEPIRPWGLSTPSIPTLPVTNSPAVNWGVNVITDLPAVFSVAVPDDSMAPRVKRGDVVRFQRDLEPKAGDGVLVVDETGTWYFRLYRVRRVGEWEAHPIHPDFQPLLAAADKLRLVAVLIGIESQRWG